MILTLQLTASEWGKWGEIKERKQREKRKSAFEGDNLPFPGQPSELFMRPIERGGKLRRLRRFLKKWSSKMWRDVTTDFSWGGDKKSENREKSVTSFVDGPLGIFEEF